MNSEPRTILFHACYVVCWTLALLGVTFTSLFRVGMVSDLQPKNVNEAVDMRFFPFGNAIVLFLLDVIFVYVKENIEGKNPDTDGVTTIAFFLPFVFVLFPAFLLGGCPRIACVCLILSWICLFIIKSLKTNFNVMEKNELPASLSDKFKTD